MTARRNQRRARGLLALALIGIGYLGLPALDGATRHPAHGARADLAHVDDGTSSTGHRCLLPDAYPTAAASLPATAPAHAAVQAEPAGVTAPAPVAPRDRHTPPARAPPHA